MMSNWLIVFIYTLCAYGACNVIVYGSGPFKIFEKLRYWTSNINEHLGSLFECMMCMPANFGWICSLINWFFIPVAFTPFNILFAGHAGLWWLAMLCDGAFTSGCVWIIHHIEEYLENMAEGISPNSKLNNENEIIDDDDYIE